ncbi:MAG: trypsin-like serine protease [Myxococcota bacterium]|nr:trypsin-like serine protease [Myxococcota bacterium]
MRLYLWLFLFLGMAGFLGSCDLDEGAQPLPKADGIVKGQVTGPDVWKGVVAFVAGNSTFCTGTLIHPRVILTAGHCMRLISHGYNYMANLQDLHAKGGANVGFNGGGGFALPEISTVQTHPGWDGVQNTELSPGPKVDLALALLSADTQIGTYCLQAGQDPVVDDTGVAVGYGRANTNLGALTGRRRMGEVTVLEVWDRELKTGEPAGTCSGDSGGPLFVEQGDNSVVGGVVSRGTAGCIASAGSVFTKISAYADWIDEQVFAWTGDHLGDCLLTSSGQGSDTGEEPSTNADTEKDTGTGKDTGSAKDTGAIEDTSEPTHGDSTVDDSDTAGEIPDNETDETDSTDDPAQEGRQSSDSGGCSLTPTATQHRFALLPWLVTAI